MKKAGLARLFLCRFVSRFFHERDDSFAQIDQPPMEKVFGAAEDLQPGARLQCV